jgi:hypothetical protein
VCAHVGVYTKEDSIMCAYVICVHMWMYD